MSGEHVSYDLTELSARAGVTPRTVRYYVQQGLLPSPSGRGPGAWYDSGHLDRLHLIKRLQREHLPLAEIRRRLEVLDDSAVRDLVRAAPPPAPSSALAYIREVLGGAHGTREQHAEHMRVSHAEQPMRMSVMSRGAEPPRAAERSNWERIQLTPDLELHVRRPLSREHNRLVERLIDFARTLFDEDVS